MLQCLPTSWLDCITERSRFQQCAVGHPTAELSSAQWYCNNNQQQVDLNFVNRPTRHDVKLNILDSRALIYCDINRERERNPGRNVDVYAAPSNSSGEEEHATVQGHTVMKETGGRNAVNTGFNKILNTHTQQWGGRKTGKGLGVGQCQQSVKSNK